MRLNWDWDSPVLVDGLRTWELRLARDGLLFGFAGHGRAVAQAGMQADGVVSAFDAAEAGHARFGLRGKPAAAEWFGFEGGEEALGHGVVVGVAARSH